MSIEDSDSPVRIKTTTPFAPAPMIAPDTDSEPEEIVESDSSSIQTSDDSLTSTDELAEDPEMDKTLDTSREPEPDLHTQDPETFEWPTRAASDAASGKITDLYHRRLVHIHT